MRDDDWEEVDPEAYLFAHWRQKQEHAETLGPGEDTQDSFLVRWNALLELSPKERIRELAKSRERLDAARQTPSDLSESAKLVVDVTEMAFLVNRTSMGTNKAGHTAEDRALVKETEAIIRSVVEMLAESRLAVTLFQTVQDRSNGHTLRHVVRVFTLMVGFLLSYNQLHSQGLGQKLRKAFSPLRRDAYRRLLPSLADNWMTSDNLVRLPALSVKQIREYALGALLHDVGKIMDLDYFESATNYDRDKTESHPILGCGLFLRTYGTAHEEARYIIGDHHNYLFHPDGYGLTRWERKRGQRVPLAPECSITDTLGVYLGGAALGFLPVEICSLIDVYDALTDPTRTYKKSLTPGQTVPFIETNFVAVGKIDPILFQLFVDYLKSNGLEAMDVGIS